MAPLGGPTDVDTVGPELEASSKEAKPQHVIARPDAPSQSEIDRHVIDHIPYRAWCLECVEGFGREKPHSSSKEEVRSIPMFAFDYM